MPGDPGDCRGDLHLFQLLNDGIHIGVLCQCQGSPVHAITLPQVAYLKTPQPQDAVGEFVSYYMCMTRAFVADANLEGRAALRLVLLDLKMEVVGEAADWETTLAQAPVNRTDMLLIDWDMLPKSPVLALGELRAACPEALVIILISHLDARQQAALSAGADAFISKGETPERVSERLLTAAAGIRSFNGAAG